MITSMQSRKAPSQSLPIQNKNAVKQQTRLQQNYKQTNSSLHNFTAGEN